VTTSRWAIYIRRSMKALGDADVSDSAQEHVARGRIPAGAEVVVIRDSGGHQSGFSDERSGYQELLQMVRAGEIAGIAAYDDSRLNRNAENALALYRACLAQGVKILTGATSEESLFSSGGKLSYGLQAIVAEHFRNQASDRMVQMFQTTFEQGGHRGQDPFGYATARDVVGRVLHPRRLQPVEAEAAVVRRIIEELARVPFAEIADGLNRDGVVRPAPGPWTDDAVKSVWDRRWIYAGFVVRGHRHEDRRPGTHPPILSEEDLRLATLGVELRRRGRGKPPSSTRRVYLLRGLAYCSCGTKMRGDARVHGGREYRYMACPVADKRLHGSGPAGEERACSERRAKAEVVEGAVLDRVRELILPPSVLEAAREELARRVALPVPGATGAQRARLRGRLENLRKQHEWGDVTDAAYRTGRDEIERALILLPDPDKLVDLDTRRDVLVSMASNLDRATPEQRRELVELLSQGVSISGGAVVKITWTPAAAAFFEASAGEALAR
jgi:DNA invertase Pin-like site-specific DNA recombinase